MLGEQCLTAAVTFAVEMFESSLLIFGIYSNYIRLIIIIKYTISILCAPLFQKISVSKT